MAENIGIENSASPEIDLKGKRVAGIDFGTKQMGIAVCDEFHITISTKGVLFREKPDFWPLLLKVLETERVSAVVVGMPYKEDGSVSQLMRLIHNFTRELHKRTNIPVLLFDESFSTRRAFDTMAEIGVKKMKQQQKGMKDRFAAAVILRDFLDELPG
ncbi:MAG: Holliday junction resolvase RuvX [Bacteroidota bacterium]